MPRRYVTTVPKKGDEQNVANYCSIVKNFIFGKMLDFINEARFSEYMRKYAVDSQHGFMPMRSTMSNLAVYSQFINKKLKNQKQVDAIYTDMRAAYDKDDHKILLKKLQKMGIVGNALKWVESFLINCKLIV